jgi:uncharacterized protein YnzC (UPF0291/DUF896 family)
MLDIGEKRRITLISKEKLTRINQLSKKSKTEGLTKEETLEQQKLREEYVKNFRKQFENTLHSVKVVDTKGNDVTPEKLKVSKNQKNNSTLH